MNSIQPNRWTDDRGATATEYAVVLGAIVLVATGGLFALSRWSTSTLRNAATTASGNAQTESPATPPAPEPPGTPPPSTPPAPPVQPKGQLQDQFNDSGALNWESSNGNWSEKDGALVSESRYATATTEVGWTDYSYTLDMQTTKAGKSADNVTRALFRYQDSDNYYAVIPKTNGSIELAKMQDGNWRPTLAYAQVGLDPLQVHTYSVDVVGNQITVWADGKQYLSYTDPNPVQRGGVGVANERSTGVIDNVVVREK